MKTNTPVLQHSITSVSSVRLVASPNAWIESEAVRQLYAVAALDGVLLAVGFPDLHPSQSAPVGSAFITADVIYPHLIGNDIGCGMAFFKTDLARRHLKLDRCAEFRFDLEHPWEGDTQEFLAARDLESTDFDELLGTIGGRNHFAELQTVEQILDAREFKRCGLGKQQIVMLVHSGSRGFGESVLRAFIDEHGSCGAAPESVGAAEYFRGHDLAVCWAKANRELIAHRFATALGTQAECLWDGCHNSITPQSRTGVSPVSSVLSGDGEERQAGRLSYVHRRGAVSAEGEFVVIPGSCGTLSYLVKPIGDGINHAWSLAHGAGRKWARSETRLRMRERFRTKELIQTPLGNRVICESRDLLYEEAPAAYKNIETIIQDLVDAGFASVIASFRPLLTYKMRKWTR